MRDLPNAAPTRKPPTTPVRLLIVTEHEARVLEALAGLADFDPVPVVAHRLARCVRAIVARSAPANEAAA